MYFVSFEQKYYDSIIPWNNDLYLLIVRSILSPQKIGSTAKSLRLSDKYYTNLEKCLTLIMNKTTVLVSKEFIEVLKEEANEYLPHFAEVHCIVELAGDMKNRIHALKLFVKGLATVQKSKIHDFRKVVSNCHD